MKKMLAILLTMVMLVALVGCAGDDEKDTFIIGMSQCNVGEPWRVAMNAQIAAAAEKYPELEVVFADAAQDNSKQVTDVENFITQKVDLLIISPNESKPLTAVVKKAYDSGIPVIVLDRRVDGSSYTQFIGGDNVQIGLAAGEFVAKTLGAAGGNVVEIKGLEGATPQQERNAGFMKGIASNPNVEIIYSQSSDWLRDKAITVMEQALQVYDKIDVVYGHNDPSAIGAYIAAENAGRQDEMIFIGIDALPTPDGGIQEVINGRLAASYVYPTGGADAIDSAYQILVEGKTDLPKEVILETIEITADNAKEMLAQFGG